MDSLGVPLARDIQVSSLLNTNFLSFICLLGFQDELCLRLVKTNDSLGKELALLECQAERVRQVDIETLLLRTLGDVV
jgi:hypothetical protein